MEHSMVLIFAVCTATCSSYAWAWTWLSNSRHAGDDLVPMLQPGLPATPVKVVNPALLKNYNFHPGVVVPRL